MISILITVLTVHLLSGVPVLTTDSITPANNIQECVDTATKVNDATIKAWQDNKGVVDGSQIVLCMPQTTPAAPSAS